MEFLRGVKIIQVFYIFLLLVPPVESCFPPVESYFPPVESCFLPVEYCFPPVEFNKKEELPKHDHYPQKLI